MYKDTAESKRILAEYAAERAGKETETVSDTETDSTDHTEETASSSDAEAEEKNDSENPQQEKE